MVGYCVWSYWVDEYVMMWLPYNVYIIIIIIIIIILIIIIIDELFPMWMHL